MENEWILLADSKPASNGMTIDGGYVEFWDNGRTYDVPQLSMHKKYAKRNIERIESVGSTFYREIMLWQGL